MAREELKLAPVILRTHPNPDKHGKGVKTPPNPKSYIDGPKGASSKSVPGYDMEVATAVHEWEQGGGGGIRLDYPYREILICDQPNEILAGTIHSDKVGCLHIKGRQTRVNGHNIFATRTNHHLIKFVPVATLARYNDAGLELLDLPCNLTLSSKILHHSDTLAEELPRTSGLAELMLVSEECDGTTQTLLCLVVLPQESGELGEKGVHRPLHSSMVAPNLAAARRQLPPLRRVNREHHPCFLPVDPTLPGPAASSLLYGIFSLSRHRPNLPRIFYHWVDLVDSLWLTSPTASPRRRETKKPDAAW
nr:unnamed protein product [Digitaria exilis]